MLNIKLIANLGHKSSTLRDPRDCTPMSPIFSKYRHLFSGRTFILTVMYSEIFTHWFIMLLS